MSLLSSGGAVRVSVACKLHRAGSNLSKGWHGVRQVAMKGWSVDAGGEENTIKELLHKHLINYTPGYGTEKLDEQPLVTKHFPIRYQVQ